MIRRSFNIRFREPIIKEIKITTIRDKEWPIGKPIMAFNWSGAAYRSPQSVVAPIVVANISPISLTMDELGLTYKHPMSLPRPLWSCEGFESRDDMDSWFRSKMKIGTTVTKYLHHFRLAPEYTNPKP